MKFKIGFATIAALAVSAVPVTASAHNVGHNHSHQSSNNGGNQLVGGLFGALQAVSSAVQLRSVVIVATALSSERSLAEP